MRIRRISSLDARRIYLSCTNQDLWARSLIWVLGYGFVQDGLGPYGRSISRQHHELDVFRNEEMLATMVLLDGVIWMEYFFLDYNDSFPVKYISLHYPVWYELKSCSHS